MGLLQKTKIFFNVLTLIFLLHSKGFSQIKFIDSLRLDYQKTSDPNLKLYKAAEIINVLVNEQKFEEARKMITNLEDLNVSKSNLGIKKGILLLSKGFLCVEKGSFSLSSNYARQSLKYFDKNNFLKINAKSLIILNYHLMGQFDSCIRMGAKTLTEIKDNTNIFSELEILMTMANSYDFIGDRAKAVQISFKAIDLAKENKKINKLAVLYINLSSFYKDENTLLAKQYALKALNCLRMNKNIVYENIFNSCYLMLGNIYYNLKIQDSSKYYYLLCIESSKKTNDQRMYLAALGNMGNIAMDQQEYNKALEYNFLTLSEYKKLGLLTEITVAYGSLADLYKDTKEYKKAVLYYDSALMYTKKIQSADDYIYNYKGLSETYEMMGNTKDALKYYKLYQLWNDSVNNNQNSKKISQLELDFKYKAEQREKDLIQKNKDLIIQEKIKQQNYIIWAGVLGGLSLVIFLGFTIKSNIEKKKTNKQLQVFNDEILQQKNIIEEKNHEITDSITYASRIQQGVIPDEDELRQLLPNHFVFFKPRDIVSGDFYWACKVKSKTEPNTKRTVVAVVDCTGHGVPGAFMSLVGNTLLNQTINRSSITTPAQALDYINIQLPKTIKSKSSTGAIKDGMEVAMCDFNFDTLTMQFAGANSNIYIIRNKEIKIYKGDKQPIGESFSGTTINYTNQIISLQKDDCVYLISDGYADQFGGAKGKKFKYKQLENLFCEIAEKKVDEQREILARAFDDWKSHHEQVDDVLIMGIKI